MEILWEVIHSLISLLTCVPIYCMWIIDFLHSIEHGGMLYFFSGCFSLAVLCSFFSNVYFLQAADKCIFELCCIRSGNYFGNAYMLSMSWGK